jgi:hypothetical protein
MTTLIGGHQEAGPADAQPIDRLVITVSGDRHFPAGVLGHCIGAVISWPD